LEHHNFNHGRRSPLEVKFNRAIQAVRAVKRRPGCFLRLARRNHPQKISRQNGEGEDIEWRLACSTCVAWSWSGPARARPGRRRRSAALSGHRRAPRLGRQVACGGQQHQHASYSAPGRTRQHSGSAARALPKKFRRCRRGGHYLGGGRGEPWSSGCWRLLQHRRRPAGGSDCHGATSRKSNAHQPEAGKRRDRAVTTGRGLVQESASCTWTAT
jgi:hypothetical protein